MREYKQSVDLMPQHHAAVYTLAQCLVQRKQFSPAIKYLENSPKHMQEEPEARQLKQWRTDVTQNLLTEWYKSFNRTPSLWKTCFQLPFCPTRVSIRLLLWQIHRVISRYVWVVPAFCACLASGTGAEASDHRVLCQKRFWNGPKGGSATSPTLVREKNKSIKTVCFF